MWALFIMALFILLGLFIVIKPDSYIKFIQLYTRKIWGADLKVTKSTERRIRIIGILFLIIGLIVIANFLFFLIKYKLIL